MRRHSRIFRRPLRPGKPPAPAAVPTTYSYDFSASVTDLYERQNSTVLRGSTTCTVAAAIYIPDSSPAANDYIITHRVSGVSRGWYIRFSFASIDRIDAGAYNGSGSLIGSPGWSFSASDYDKMHLVGFTLSSDILRLFVDGVEIGSGTSCVGYTAPNSTDYLQAGGLRGFSELDEAYLIGFGGSDTIALSGADWATWYSNIKAADDMVNMPGGCDAWWKASSNIGAGANWADETGSETLTTAGTPTVTLLDKDWK